MLVSDEEYAHSLNAGDDDLIVGESGMISAVLVVDDELFLAMQVAIGWDDIVHLSQKRSVCFHKLLLLSGDTILVVDYRMNASRE